MGRIVAISSGDLTSTMAINKYALKLTGKDKPKVLFLPTASGDDEGYVDKMRGIYEGLGCSFKALLLTKGSCSASELSETVFEADLIYVGGGNTIHMMEIWKTCGMDRLLRAVYQTDSAVLTGLSAGAMCWFMDGFSDSIPGPMGNTYGMTGPLLSILPYSFCPHFEDKERAVFKTFIRDGGCGLAMESDTAYVNVNDKEFFVKSNPDAGAYAFIKQGGYSFRETIDCQLLR